MPPLCNLMKNLQCNSSDRSRDNKNPKRTHAFALEMGHPDGMLKGIPEPYLERILRPGRSDGETKKPYLSHGGHGSRGYTAPIIPCPTQDCACGSQMDRFASVRLAKIVGTLQAPLAGQLEQSECPKRAPRERCVLTAKGQFSFNLPGRTQSRTYPSRCQLIPLQTGGPRMVFGCCGEAIVRIPEYPPGTPKQTVSDRRCSCRWISRGRLKENWQIAHWRASCRSVAPG